MTKAGERLRDFLDSKEVQIRITDFIERHNREVEVNNKQLERLNRLGNFKQFTKKVVKKYYSDKYRDYWFNRGFEPPRGLFWFLFDYAEKYGRECSEDEWRQYGNYFTSALFFCDGYYFNRMDGQGSIIKVIKQKKRNC